MLRPHQASRHLSALLRRQLQRHTQEIQKHGGAGLRLPLTPALSADNAKPKVGLTRVLQPHQRLLGIYDLS